MTGIISELFRKLNRAEPFRSISGPLLPNVNRGYEIDITVTRDVRCQGKKTKSKNSTWITIKRIIPPISPLSPPISNLSTNNDKNGGDTTSDSGGIISTPSKYLHPRAASHAHISKSGGSGDVGDIFRLYLVRVVIKKD